ncbi:MAG: NAD(P)/FAD-dependent oxidoreductase, partial [Nitrospinaceae bacterium]
MKPHDAVVIGAGPAGCAAALFLAQKGYQPLVLDQAKFPRDKVCGEFISPAADDLLDDLGLLARIEAQNPRRLHGVALSAYGDQEVFLDYPPRPDRPGPVTSLSLPRFWFDRLLVDRVREAGLEVLEERRVTGLMVQDGRVVGVQGWDASRTPFTLRARVVLDAGGRQSVAIRQFHLRRRAGGKSRVALAAHWRGGPPLRDYCYMHVSPPGYTGTASVHQGGVNVVLVVDPGVIRGQDLNAVYRRIVLAEPRRRALLAGARPVESVRSVDSLAFSVAPAPVGGLLLAGDAMGFLDPFTGEGIYLSLRSAQVAAAAVDEGLQQGGVSRRGVQLYEQARHREFGARFRLSRILQRIIYSKRLCRQVMATLARHPSLAAPLIGAIGDYLPAEAVVRPGYLARGVRAWLATRCRKLPAEAKNQDG